MCPPHPLHCPQVPAALWGSARAPSFHQGLPWACTPQSARFPQSLLGALPKFKHLPDWPCTCSLRPGCAFSRSPAFPTEQRVLLFARPVVPPGPEVLVGFPHFPRKGVFVWRLKPFGFLGQAQGPNIQGSVGGGGGVLLFSSSPGSRVSSPTARGFSIRAFHEAGLQGICALGHTHMHTLSHTLSLTLCLTHSLPTLSQTHSLTHAQSLTHSHSPSTHTHTFTHILSHRFTVSHTYTFPHSHTHTHCLTHSFSHAHAHSYTLTLTLCCTHSLSHTQSHTHSHTHTVSVSHTLLTHYLTHL